MIHSFCIYNYTALVCQRNIKHGLKKRNVWNMHYFPNNWLQWRHNERNSVSKSQASRLFTQSFIKAQIKESTKAPRHWPFVRGIHRWLVNSPHKEPVTRKMCPFDDVIMLHSVCALSWFVVVRYRLNLTFKISYWHGLMIGLVPMKQPWRTRV